MSYYPVLSPFVVGPRSPYSACAPFTIAPVSPLLVARFGQRPSAQPNIGQLTGPFQPGQETQFEHPIVQTAQCQQPECFLFPIPLPQGPTVADAQAADRVPRGRILRVTDASVPAGWAEVIVNLDTGSYQRRYVRTADLIPPSGASTDTGTGTGTGTGTPTGGGTDPELTRAGEPSVAARIGEFILLTSPAWGSFLLTRLLR